jgi:hypothetical protein
MVKKKFIKTKKKKHFSSIVYIYSIVLYDYLKKKLKFEMSWPVNIIITTITTTITINRIVYIILIRLNSI